MLAQVKSWTERSSRLRNPLREIGGLLKLRELGIRQFEPKVQIEISKGPYTIRTARSRTELLEALRLRHDVFYKEALNKSLVGGLDVDPFDGVCDHLLIIENRTQKVLGTYRLNSSLFSQRFYSSTEFNLGQLFRLPGIKLEIGRACIHPEFRRGAIIALLWRGIAEYILKTNTDYLFGCASIKTEKAEDSAKLLRYFNEQGWMANEVSCPPTLAYTQQDLYQEMHSLRVKYPERLGDEVAEEAKRLIPPLFKSYLRAGAVVCGEPAYDRAFRCIDFLVVLNRKSLNDLHSQRYRVEDTSAQ